MPLSRAEALLDMYSCSPDGITYAYWLCVLGMAEKVREACARGETGRLTRLLDDDVKPLPDEHGRSPLLIAAAAGHIQVCEILLRHNVDVNTPDNIIL
ncbi:hypothetical protein PV325_010984 [Microctonus aethiopoides]|nr:hypothetical protein PV325_010984 [Microctonus aethiopoides]